MAAECAQCGARKSHPVHLKALSMAGHHPFLDSRKAGLKPMSEGKRAYLDSEEHREAYAPMERASGCAAEAAGAPTSCAGPITPHHILPRSKAGGQAKAEEYPVVPACSFHNQWFQEGGRDWATTHYFTVGNRDWPFLISDAWLTAERERRI